MADDRRMKDIPMLDIDRERMREEFEDFDNMTIDEWREAALKRQAELARLIFQLSESRYDRRTIKGAAYQATKAALREAGEGGASIRDIAERDEFDGYADPHSAIRRSLATLSEEGLAECRGNTTNLDAVWRWSLV